MPYAYKHSYESYTYVHQFDNSLTNVPKKANNQIHQARFLETITTYANRGPIIYTDGSKSVSEDRVGSAIYSSDLNVLLKFKLPPETSIFSAESWAILQAINLIEDRYCDEASWLFKCSSGYIASQL